MKTDIMFVAHSQIDEKLCQQNYVYKSFRVKNAIGPMKVIEA